MNVRVVSTNTPSCMQYGEGDITIGGIKEKIIRNKPLFNINSIIREFNIETYRWE